MHLLLMLSLPLSKTRKPSLALDKEYARIICLFALFSISKGMLMVTHLKQGQIQISVA